MWSIIFLCLISSADPPVEKVKTKQADDAQATTQGLQELLEKVWNATPESAKKAGTAVLSKYRRMNANMPSLEYGYGVALAKHQQWEAAETNFRAVATKHRQSPRAWLAVANAHLRLGKPALAIEDLRKAWEAAPKDEDVLLTIAGVTNFLIQKPLPKYIPDSSRKLQDDVRAGLSPDQKNLFDLGVNQSNEYISNLEKLREELMEPVKIAESQAAAAEQEAQQKGSKVAILRAEYQSRVQNIQQIAAIANARVVEIDMRALGGNGGLSVAMQAERTRILQASQAEIELQEVRLQELGIRLAQKDREYQEVAFRAQRFAKEASDGKSVIDKQLALPPPYWDPSQEKEQLLHVGFTDIQLAPQQKEKDRAPRKSLSDDDKARVLLSMADALRSSNKPGLAKSYFERILKEFPNTSAATDAKWELEQVGKEIDDLEKEGSKKAAEAADKEIEKSNSKKARKGSASKRSPKGSSKGKVDSDDPAN